MKYILTGQIMSNEKQTIHDFDLKIIYEYFSNTDRQGPGNTRETLKALSFIDGLTEKSKIADIGCGTGGQTMTLGQNTSCEIIGIDVWQDFINKFNQNSLNQNFHNRVKGIVGNMENLPLTFHTANYPSKKKALNRKSSNESS